MSNESDNTSEQAKPAKRPFLNLFARRQIEKKRKAYSRAWQKLDGIDIKAEYELIQQKKSDLPKVMRDLVVAAVIAEKQEAAKKAEKSGQVESNDPQS